jgi:hypothetical protein
MLAVEIVVAAGLPIAGTAAAAQGTAASRITATDYSSDFPALVSLDPVSGDVIGTFAQNAEDGVLSPKGSTLAYIQRDDTCIPQTEGCTAASRITATDYSSDFPALVSLDPVSGDVIGTFAQNAEDGVLSPKGHLGVHPARRHLHSPDRGLYPRITSRRAPATLVA